MAGKKIGKLSKSMIIRRKPRDEESGETGVAGLGSALEEPLENTGTLVIPRHGRRPSISAWDSAKVVPLRPRSPRDAAADDDEAVSHGDDDETEALLDDGTLQGSRPAVRRPVSAPMPKSGVEQAAFEAAEATNELLVKALRSADLNTAETLFGHLSGLSSVAALAVLYDPKGEDLALTCRALGMDQLQFVSVYILSRKLGLGEEALAPQDLARLVALFEASDLAEARTRLKGLQDGEAGSPARPFRHD